MDDGARIWAARILAPLAFLAAATLLVVLVQRALRDDEGQVETVAATTTVATTAPETESGGQEGGQRRYYRVQAGDTLTAIAERFDTTVERLLQLNPNIDPLALTPRQRIRVA
jgi:peptidoglycan endopeptidase LytE